MHLFSRFSRGFAVMQVLILDDASSMDARILRFLEVRGYEVTIVKTPNAAAEQIRQAEFDGVVLEVSTCGECLGLLEMRQLVRTSSVAFVTKLPVVAIAAVAEAEGSMEFQTLPNLIENLEHLPQPALLAGGEIPTALLEVCKKKALNVSIARTLQFSMNLMADGWCQIVWLELDTPARASASEVMVVHRIGAPTLAILASAIPATSPGISCSMKPATEREWLTLLRHMDGNRVAPCGRSDFRTKNPQPPILPRHSTHSR